MSKFDHWLRFFGVETISTGEAASRLLERKVEASDYNWAEQQRRIIEANKKMTALRLRLMDACDRVVELEGECNQWAALDATSTVPYPPGVTPYSRGVKH
jgi:hypothetical protein